MMSIAERFGTDEQKAMFPPPILRGEVRWFRDLSEPVSRWCGRPWPT